MGGRIGIMVQYPDQDTFDTYDSWTNSLDYLFGSVALPIW